MRRRTVEEEVVFLDVLAVIPLLIRQTKHALFEDRVLGIPQGHGQTEVLLVITKAPHAVFVPAIRPAAGMIVRERVPGVPVGAVILTHGSPGALAEIGAPALPIGLARLVFCQATVLRVGNHRFLPTKRRECAAVCMAAALSFIWHFFAE